MTSKLSKAAARPATRKPAAKVPARQAAKAQSVGARFPRDEMSTGKGSARLRAATKAIAPAASGADYQLAFEKKVAAMERAVARGVPGAREELAAVLRDRAGIQKGVADLEKRIAANEDPATWAKVTPRSRALAEQADARAKLHEELAHMKTFGVKVAGMNPQERKNLQNFFRLAKEDPAAFKRFVDGVKAGHAPPAAAQVAAAPQRQGPANIQTAIQFGLSQLGAPYVGGASPYRFGTPGDGRTYQMAGQRAYLSPRGVVGYDCSGLMVTMLKKAGINISHLGSSRAMKSSLPQVPKHQLQPGDLLVKNGHVAMYLGDGKMIESVPGGVKVSPASKYLNDAAYSGHRPG